ncbi:nucleotide exchange factors-like protein [Lenzites betulinus]|nr:nucleotide exchange factors-like protein [Lenzites betulinus]
MEGLLRWGLANSDPRGPDEPPPQPRSDLDPGVIDMLLGKPDAELMKEALAIAVDETKDEDDRLQALDNFEMLIEQIDNANNLEKLQMWKPLHTLLTNPASSSEIQTQVLWILGTAMQNNPAAQHSYLALSPLSTILTFLSPTVRSGATRAKAVYTLSGLLKHNAAAVAQMESAGGWDTLRAALQDSDISVRRKVAFLLNTLLTPNGDESDDDVPANVQQPLQVPTSSEGVRAAASIAAPATPPTSSSATAQSQAVTIHPSSVPSTSAAPAPSTTSAPALAPPQTVHPNSHAALVSDPRSASTSLPTARALPRSGLLAALVGALAQPVPHGPDGDREDDADFEEKVLRGLHTYAAGGRRALPAAEGAALRGWLDDAERREGGAAQVAEKWGLTGEELGELKVAAGAGTA